MLKPNSSVQITLQFGAKAQFEAEHKKLMFERPDWWIGDEKAKLIVLTISVRGSISTSCQYHRFCVCKLSATVLGGVEEVHLLPFFTSGKSAAQILGMHFGIMGVRGSGRLLGYPALGDKERLKQFPDNTSLAKVSKSLRIPVGCRFNTMNSSNEIAKLTFFEKYNLLTIEVFLEYNHAEIKQTYCSATILSYFPKVRFL
jgi:hypothetical protein